MPFCGFTSGGLRLLYLYHVCLWLSQIIMRVFEKHVNILRICNHQSSLRQFSSILPVNLALRKENVDGFQKSWITTTSLEFCYEQNSPEARRPQNGNNLQIEKHSTKLQFNNQDSVGKIYSFHIFSLYMTYSKGSLSKGLLRHPKLLGAHCFCMASTSGKELQKPPTLGHCDGFK